MVPAFFHLACPAPFPDAPEGRRNVRRNGPDQASPATAVRRGLIRAGACVIHLKPANADRPFGHLT
ncbi:hypothetical protein HNE_1076 [Hyphomonas neptunium ATCC 15444]|uniref:Uncharacterized protein n=1 Tax=Hyphomonas neptunium (strain ATCC 15444) TaxID=228405 RepID=Q0C396_HYPNA|nr:hypothetical protein HNE_1076 [Hyphomonas neptunium ATCC 15444]